ncbi:hypothetical protein [Rhizobium sp. BE258]|uniref:hypothetical protein n=1 Tax=Rhizobium sp. BE258 TaxID=2817722 RepID=UPI00285ED343|nr:hypothetical protein [Rhizobium sp. BE258]MDR7146435.1 hypothetical protein [Rhizobium sp. BE258]
MGDLKNWYHSKTIWGALIAIGASVLHVAGIDIEAGDQSQIADSLVNISGAIGGLLAIYGRLTANTAIR